jgi:hypothetical protein
MMQLWIYGDSYAVDWREPWVWQRQFAKRMGVERVYNQACSGTNNEWILKTFADDGAQQKPGDIALIFLTDTTRRWWIEDRPELSNLASIINTKDANEFKNQDPKVFDAIIDYYTYLHRPDLTDFRLAMMTDFIRVKSIERELRLQVIPCFNMNIDWTDLYPVHGNMTFSICDKEFVSFDEIDEWYNTSIDTRANHMTLENHTVLADKLYERFTNPDGLLNLEDSEWATGFLRRSDKLTHPGLCPQLVQMAMEPGNSIPAEYWPR